MTALAKPFLVVWLDHALIDEVQFAEISADTAEDAAVVAWRERGPQRSSYRVSPIDQSMPTEIFRFERATRGS
jgi:hypothetical protein